MVGKVLGTLARAGVTLATPLVITTAGHAQPIGATISSSPIQPLNDQISSRPGLSMRFNPTTDILKNGRIGSIPAELRLNDGANKIYLYPEPSTSNKALAESLKKSGIFPNSQIRAILRQNKQNPLCNNGPTSIGINFDSSKVSPMDNFVKVDCTNKSLGEKQPESSSLYVYPTGLTRSQQWIRTLDGGEWKEGSFDAQGNPVAQSLFEVASQNPGITKLDFIEKIVANVRNCLRKKERAEIK